MIIKHEEYRFLIDCGEGTQRQILRSGAGFKRLNHSGIRRFDFNIYALGTH